VLLVLKRASPKAANPRGTLLPVGALFGSMSIKERIADGGGGVRHAISEQVSDLKCISV
jgi:hypothetical protein